MDINEILSQAKKNQKGSHLANRYSTDVKPAKKLPRSSVNPNAIKAFLDKQRNEEIKNLVKAKKDKEELQRLRDASKTTRKANSMAYRTKDNLKVYRGEDVLGLYPEPKKRRRGGPHSPPLSPEADRKHKAFMKNIVSKVKVPGVNDNSDDEYKEPILKQDARKMRKMEKRRAKARSASNLEFGDLIKMAEKQKGGGGEESSSSSENESDSGDDSDGSTDKYGRRLTAEEKYQRERRKRRELEERLKKASSQKPVPTQNKHKPPSNSLANFKIGKLNSGMSEESKKAKVQALMKKFKKSADDGRAKAKNPLEKQTQKNDATTSGPRMRKSHSTPSLTQLEENKQKKTESHTSAKHKHNGVKVERSQGHMRDPKHHKSALPSNSNNKILSKNPAVSSKHRDKLKPQRPSSDGEMRQTKIENHLKMKRRGSPSKDRVASSSKHKTDTPRFTSNPYKHTVVKQPTKRPASDTMVNPWAKSNKVPGQNLDKKHRPPPLPAGKCTLKVTSESVHTNYPGVAQEDPYIRAYKKTGKVMPKLTPEMVAQYKAAIMNKLQQERRPPPHQQYGHRGAPPPKRRYGVIGDDSEEEYDSELEGFIVDGDEEVDDTSVDVSSHIKAIFGYDKSKYGQESEWELSRMEASYKDIEKEEKRSLKIAREEDAIEAKLEEERMKKMQKKSRR